MINIHQTLSEQLQSACANTRYINAIEVYVIDFEHILDCTISHLICTLISENEGLEKLRSASNLRKISVPAHLNFFSVCHLSFFQILYHTVDERPNLGYRSEKVKDFVSSDWIRTLSTRGKDFYKLYALPLSYRGI